MKVFGVLDIVVGHVLVALLLLVLIDLTVLEHFVFTHVLKYGCACAVAMGY